MTISVACDACGTEHKLRPELRGKRFKCKECGTAVRVPLEDEIEAAEELPGDDDFEEELPQRRVRSSGKSGTGKRAGGKSKAAAKSSGMNPLVIGGIAAGGVALLGLAIVIWMVTASGKKPVEQPVVVAPAPVAPITPAAHQAPQPVVEKPTTVPAEPAPPPLTPQEELAALYQKIRAKRAEYVAILQGLTEPAQLEAAKAAILAADSQVWTLHRQRLELEVSGKLTPEEVDKAKANDAQDRRKANPRDPTAGVEGNLEIVVKKMLSNRGRVLLPGYVELAKAAAVQRRSFVESLPAELSGRMSNLSGDPELIELEKILPPEMSAKELVAFVKPREEIHGPGHCASIVLLWPPGGDFGFAFLSRAMTIDPSPRSRDISEKFYFLDTIPQLVTLAHFDGIESREELVGLIDFGEVVFRNDELGLYVVQARADYVFNRNQPGASLKNPNYVWDGFQPPTQDLPSNAEDKIVLRFDLEDVDLKDLRKVSQEILSKIVGKKLARAEFVLYRSHGYWIVTGTDDFDDLVKSAKKVAKVSTTIPERRIMILEARKK